ncbi:VCBS repeat-containing protein [Streptomyces sp. NPDC047525]|uniref:FG-GAP repeat domain-containing protein n=1 Tax=Streptomyces sp. NPDC047525 TaxID=3155264 RepID=UPI0033FE2CD5
MRAARRAGLVALCCTAALLAGCGASDDGNGTKRSGRPAAGKASKEPSPKDFNGDGYDDYATVLQSGRLTDRNRERTTSTLTVVFGSPDGLRPEWSVNLPAGPEQAVFGRLLRTDLDDDGFTDLVSSRRESGSSDTEAFAMFGGARGLSGATRLDVDGFTPEAAGDFDGDGATDLFDGSRTLFGPFDRKKKAPARSEPVDTPNAFPLDVVTGDFDGDSRTDVVMTNEYHGDDYEQNDDPPPAPAQAVYFRGGAKGLARDSGPQGELEGEMGTYDGPRGGGAGDVDGDGIDDFVATGEAAHGISKLTVIHGSKAGLGSGRASRVMEGRGSTWGSGPMAGDVDGDRRADLVAGRPGFHIIDPDRILLLRGGPHGPTTERTQTVTGGDEGLPEGIAPNQLEHLDLLDVDGDRRQDVVVFSQKWKKAPGHFLVIGGTGKGLETEGVQHFTADDVGVQLWRE